MSVQSATGRVTAIIHRPFPHLLTLVVLDPISDVEIGLRYGTILQRLIWRVKPSLIVNQPVSYTFSWRNPTTNEPMEPTTTH
jgi:hypothetical protein